MPGTPIAIIGAGVTGLSTAFVLARGGGEVVVFGSAQAARPASGVAPAGFTPYPGAPDVRLRAWTLASFAHFAHLARTEPRAGVSLLELREYCSRPPWRTPWLDEALGVRTLAAPQGWHTVLAGTRPHIDTDRYLPFLSARLAEHGVRPVPRHVASLADLFAEGFGVVVNCAGLGAGPLAGDGLVQPARGQVVHVPNTMGLRHSLHDDAPDPAREVAYIFTFPDRLVLGGTFEPGHAGAEVNTHATRAIIERCRRLLTVDGQRGVERLGERVLDVRAAARPCRQAGGGAAGGEGIGQMHAATSESIRLEAELTPRGPVVHNYGHGRSGVTLSWGCALECARLVAQARTA